MSDFPNEGSFWKLLNSANMGSGSTSNSQFLGSFSQASMTPEQQGFFESQQQAFLEIQQSQNRQQNQPKLEIPQQQSQSSNSFSQTESQPQRDRMKRASKKGKVSDPIGDVTLRWKPEEETLLAKCFVALFEDRNVGRSQPKDMLWFRVLNGFNRTPQKKIKSDTSTSTGGSSSSSQFGEFMSHKLRLKRKATEKAFEVAKEKDRTITRLEELRFLALSTKDLSNDDAYYINLQKEAIKQKL
nr:hypothetical protein [Tanacetum cinerariifolium]GEW56310.1 hypothetical protein [Tanacetum cinerariifolium]